MTGHDLKDAFHLLAETHISDMDRKVFAEYLCDQMLIELASLHKSTVIERLNHWQNIKEEL